MGMYAFLSAALVYVTLKEPQRGAKEEDLTEVLSKGIHTYSLTFIVEVTTKRQIHISSYGSKHADRTTSMSLIPSNIFQKNLALSCGRNNILYL